MSAKKVNTNITTSSMLGSSSSTTASAGRDLYNRNSLDYINTRAGNRNDNDADMDGSGSPKYHGSSAGIGIGRTFGAATSATALTMTDNQKQAVLLLVVSLAIYVACQFDATFTFLIPEKAALDQDNSSGGGPPPGTHIQMIAVLGERNSGTRWTSSHLTDCFNDTIEVSSYVL